MLLVKNSTIGTQESCTGWAISAIIANSVHLTTSLNINIHARLEWSICTTELGIRWFRIDGVVYTGNTFVGIMMLIMIGVRVIFRFGGMVRSWSMVWLRLMVGRLGSMVWCRFVVGRFGGMVRLWFMVSRCWCMVWFRFMVGRFGRGIRCRFMVGRGMVWLRFMVSRGRGMVWLRFMVSRCMVWFWFMVGRGMVGLRFMVSRCRCMVGRGMVWLRFLVCRWGIGCWLMVGRFWSFISRFWMIWSWFMIRRCRCICRFMIGSRLLLVTSIRRFLITSCITSIRILVGCLICSPFYWFTIIITVV
jgi:hypothetical protein